jgi:hypothetical protein
MNTCASTAALQREGAFPAWCARDVSRHSGEGAPSAQERACAKGQERCSSPATSAPDRAVQLAPDRRVAGAAVAAIVLQSLLAAACIVFWQVPPAETAESAGWNVSTSGDERPQPAERP